MELPDTKAEFHSIYRLFFTVQCDFNHHYDYSSLSSNHVY